MNKYKVTHDNWIETIIEAASYTIDDGHLNLRGRFFGPVFVASFSPSRWISVMKVDTVD